MTMTFAVADLHGRHDLLLAAITRIEETSPRGGKIVFLGDYIDRGPQSAQIIETLMAGPSSSAWQWVCLQGNHEKIMLTALMAPAQALSWWMGNGGGNTLVSYGAKNGGSASEALSLIPAEHVRWLCDLPLIFVDDHRVFVHAGVNPDLPLDEQDAEVLQWKLYKDGDGRGHGDRHVVHGHHQFEEGPIEFDGRTDLDTLAWFTGRLVIGAFDDDVPGGVVNMLEVVGPSINDLVRA